MGLEIVSTWWLLVFIPGASFILLLWRRVTAGLAPARQWVALIIRLAILLLGILSLSGIQLRQPTSGEAVVFVGDLSASVAANQADIQSWIVSALSGARASRGDQAAIVAFGASAAVEQAAMPARQAQTFHQFQSVIDASRSNIASGLDLAAALLPSDQRRRVVLLSDGQQNAGDARLAASILAAQSIRLDVVPMVPATGPEVLLSSLSVPAQLNRGEAVRAAITIDSTTPTHASVNLFVDGQLASTVPITLTMGTQRIEMLVPPPTMGIHVYRAVINPIPGADTLPQNNTATAFTTVLGPPQVLIVGQTQQSSQTVAAALRASGMAVTAIPASSLPPSLVFLQRYAAMVLVDVSADTLPPAVLPLLVPYVRDLGHGLVAIGGQHSYALGNYGGTPLESLLPVRMDIPQRQDVPTVAVAVIVESLESNYTVNVSKQAAKGIIDALTPRDQIAISDAATDWAIPLQSASHKDAIKAAIDAMNPGDPASYAGYLQDAAHVLAGSHAAIKHIILLGDGDAYDTYQPLIEQIARQGITVSTIASGVSGAYDTAMMADIARWGHGRAYVANSVEAIPQIFLQEERAVARTGLIVGRFTPIIVQPSPLLDGLHGMPTLNGYVATTPKPTSQIVLMSGKADPILASWQIGQGRTVAWTGDSQTALAGGLSTWPDTRRLWANLVSYVLPPSSTGNLTLSVSSQNGIGDIVVSLAPRALHVHAASPRVQARVVNPTGQSQSIDLQQISTNQFQASFPASGQGVYLVHVTASEQTGGAVSGGVAVPYSPEYATLGANMTLLADLARLGHGKVLSARPGTAAASSYADNLPRAYSVLPLNTWLLLIMLFLIPFDVAARRLSIHRADLHAALLTARGTRHNAASLIHPTTTVGPLTAVRDRRAEQQRTRQRVASIAASAAHSDPAPDTSAEVTPNDDSPSLPSSHVQQLLADRGKRRR